MKAGIEVHQQLSTGKLFCSCPTALSEEVRGSFVRWLRPTSGENLRVDRAAAFQAARGLRYRYEGGPSNCLVEMDEEPPHPLNEEALDTALTLAELLSARPVDEVVVMRKIVIDGSNTSGFQRTALIALGGQLDLPSGKRISIQTVCLEEDAARKVREEGGEVIYRLDRLGIPLIEVATGPDISSGPEAREVAEELGALLRATRRVRRGIGTIREDLNVSTERGHRIEIKGVQELRRIQDYVDGEVARQESLLHVQDVLTSVGAKVGDPAGVDVSELFRDVTNGPLAASSRRDGPVLALALPGFAGVLRSAEGSEERLGRELADYARAAGLKGLIHSDELPAYGVTDAHVAAVRSRLHLGERDAFVLLADRSTERARNALRRVAERATGALAGIPGETRDPLPDGRTRYSRPLPGRDRMYPETDVPPIPITPERLDRVRAKLPERPAELLARLRRDHGLGAELVRQVVYGEHVDDFEALTARGHAPSLVARLLTQELPSVELKEGFEPPTSVLDQLLTATETGTIAKEGIPTVLEALARGAPSVEQAIARSGLVGFSEEELVRVVERAVDANEALLLERGEAAFSPLMGDVMREVRGRRDGREVAEALHREIDRRLKARRGPGTP
ncbi:MAG TPA: Glu-tRNA(Gln) amidotransferase subunit GatE [Thermoplasmata archaeon]|nr:Glu-tRNA(Gln) amidotransferase subunit GatE [Thermoplasmata archaeon]